MICPDVRRLLPGHLKGEPLPPAAAAHLRACPACQGEFADLAGLWQALGRLAADAPPMTLQVPAPAPRRPHRLFLAAAAGLLLALGGAALGQGLGAPRRLPLASDPGPARMLRNASAPERIKAVALMGAGEPDLAETLMALVEHDPDTQVRLAAVDALYLPAGDPALRRRLGSLLLRVDRPEVQIALVDLIVGLRERQAVEALKALAAQGRLSPEARSRVASGIRQLETKPI